MVLSSLGEAREMMKPLFSDSAKAKYCLMVPEVQEFVAQMEKSYPQVSSSFTFGGEEGGEDEEKNSGGDVGDGGGAKDPRTILEALGDL